MQMDILAQNRQINKPYAYAPLYFQTDTESLVFNSVEINHLTIRKLNKLNSLAPSIMS